jgi:hypothetical protein
MAYRSKTGAAIKKWGKRRALEIQWIQFQNMIGVHPSEPQHPLNQTQEEFNKEILSYLEKKKEPKDQEKQDEHSQ